METSVYSSEEEEESDADEIPELADQTNQYTDSSRYPSPLARS